MTTKKNNNHEVQVVSVFFVDWLDNKQALYVYKNQIILYTPIRELSHFDRVANVDSVLYGLW
jgi:hypothetical protein